MHLEQSPNNGAGTGGHRNKRPRGDHPAYRIIKIGQNTVTTPGDLKKIAVT